MTGTSGLFYTNKIGELPYNRFMLSFSVPYYELLLRLASLPDTYYKQAEKLL